MLNDNLMNSFFEGNYYFRIYNIKKVIWATKAKVKKEIFFNAEASCFSFS